MKRDRTPSYLAEEPWLLMVVFISIALAGCDTRRPNSFLIPDGYVGWVQVSFGVEGSPPLPIEDGTRIIDFPQDGKLLTSSQMDFGDFFVLDHYIYKPSGDSLDIWGEGGEIWASSHSSSHLRFFVGTEEEFAEYGASVPGGKPAIGPLPTTPE